MDNSWSAPPGTGIALLLGAFALAAAALWPAVGGTGVGTAGPGLVLLGAAALIAAYLGVTSLLLRPRLRAEPAGIVVRGLAGTRTLPWPGLEIRARRDRRWGRDSVTLELDDGDRLVVLGRWDLGAPPAAVAEELEAARDAYDPG